MLQICTAPSLIPLPSITTISTSFVTVVWVEPENKGGCPITSYHLYIAGGLDTDPWTEVESSQIINQPFLTHYAFDSTALTPGNRYKVRIGAENHIAENYSDSVGFVLANLPGQPNPPTRESDGTYLKIIMAPPTDNGGTIIENYQL